MRRIRTVPIMKSTTRFAGVILLSLCLMLVACSKKVDEEPKTVDTARLWKYLNSFRGSKQLPTPDEIENQFGKPDIGMKDKAYVAVKARIVMKEQENDPQSDYQRRCYWTFTPEEAASEKSVPVTSMIYFHNGDEKRLIIIRIRMPDKSVAGWEWSEHLVPEDQWVGPPK